MKGERDPIQLAQLRDRRCKKSVAEIAEQLSGHWREDHLFSLEQGLKVYDSLQERIGDYDCKILQQSRCRVSFIDSDHTAHAVELEADSLYEAVAQAVADFREDPLIEFAPAPMTEFTVAVLRAPTEHRLRLQQVMKWAEPTTKDGPAGITKRQRVRQLLGVQ